jgi:hypothetical protein
LNRRYKQQHRHSDASLSSPASPPADTAAPFVPSLFRFTSPPTAPAATVSPCLTSRAPPAPLPDLSFLSLLHATDGHWPSTHSSTHAASSPHKMHSSTSAAESLPVSPESFISRRAQLLKNSPVKQHQQRQQQLHYQGTLSSNLLEPAAERLHRTQSLVCPPSIRLPPSCCSLNYSPPYSLYVLLLRSPCVDLHPHTRRAHTYSHLRILRLISLECHLLWSFLFLFPR